MAAAAERLARATPGERNLLLVLDSPATTLAVAALAPHNGGFRPRQLRVALKPPSPVSAEILAGLAARPRDSAVTLAVRAAEVLDEEGLTRRFFRDFSRLHALAAERLAEMPRATAGERRSLALVILTRVLFLYFVQARGWLGGRGDFLPSLLDTALGQGHPFHRAIFEPLCFGALNSPPDRRPRASRALGDLPFLNGGLFERQAIERRYPGAALDNETWRLLFDELFERFHFTVREREDVDAVDPEMLGRVFEGLMARDRRRAQGTYFTPRELLRETVERSLAAALAGRDADAVRRIRVLDPAVGSGAFLLEVLIQLERARAALCPHERPAERRRAIVRDNLFGVDLDPMAVRLAELRLWLALVVHEDTRLDEVAPLPNLDQNLRQGDSLLSPLDLVRGRLGARGSQDQGRGGAPARVLHLDRTREGGARPRHPRRRAGPGPRRRGCRHRLAHRAPGRRRGAPAATSSGSAPPARRRPPAASARGGGSGASSWRPAAASPSRDSCRSSPATCTSRR